MYDEKKSLAKRLSVTAAVGAGAEVLGFVAGVPGLGGFAAAITQGMINRRQDRALELVSDVAEAVGEERLEQIIENDVARDQLLWRATNVAMTSDMDAKRRYLAQVVAHAMNGDEFAVGDALLIVTALAELDAPHIAALLRVRAADDANRIDPGNSDEILNEALEKEVEPILAALVRSGVVLVGSQPVSMGLLSVPRARSFSISGVNNFGRKILADLQAVEAD